MEHTPHPRKNWLHYRRLIAFFVIGGVILIAGARTFGSALDVRGWIWNAYQPKNSTDKFGLGWVSMSCLNDFDNDGQLENECVTPRPYGLEVNDGADNALGGTGANADYVQGCAWSSAYGWICFNGGDAASGAQCNTEDADNGPACADLSTNGVVIKNFNNYFYYLDSPTYNDGTWGALGSAQRSTILSLWSAADKAKSYISFPTEPGNPALASTTDPGETLFGCFNCDPETKKCGACLNASTEVEDAKNVNPNLLCWDCGNGTACTVNDTGSCQDNRDKNTCIASSCFACTAFTGVVVNQNPQGTYEMCGWGYHAYDDASAGGENSSRTLDSLATKNIGRRARIVVPPDGLPAIAYIGQDSSNFDRLKFIKCGDPGCQITSTIFLSSAGSSINASTGVAMALGTDGNPRIVYRPGTGSLTLIKCLLSDCSLLTTTPLAGWNSPADISIAVRTDDNPVISGFDSVSGEWELDATICEDSTCTVGPKKTLDATISVGSLSVDTGPPHVALDANVPIVVYSAPIDVSYYELRVVKCTGTDCSAVAPG
ncbi:MAG: hypothetical protein HY422_03405, partial [Candidatus Komeilibacteria bacterium]|nr:hypothetical protein [Candidatus Komeilibacteria bacterium]